MIDQKRDTKVLISADIRGRFDLVMPKIAQLQAKNKFDFMILLGEVCHPRASQYINSILKEQNTFPLPLYFIDNSSFSPVLQKLHPQGKQIVHNFHYLGRRGVTKINGLNLAFFNCYSKNEDPNIFNAEVDVFLQECQDKTIDILLTNQWSKEVQNISDKKGSVTSANYVSKIANAICPRYHLVACGSSFYRMAPYRNQKGGVTHFINVAPCQQELKDKYLFAITVKPNHVEQAAEDDPNYHQNPYKTTQLTQGQVGVSLQQRLISQKSKKQVRGEVIVFFEGFPEWTRKEDISEFLQRWGDISHLDAYKDRKGGRSGTVRFTLEQSTKRCLGDSGKYMFQTARIKFQARSMQQRLRVQDCWFCKTNADRSLIVWQGKHIYISLEKGPLCIYHIQIIPFNHAQCSTRLDPQEQEQLNMIKNRLSKHFTEQGCQVITYQRYLSLSEAVNHCVVHLLPIKDPQSYLRKFQTMNKDDNLRFRQWDGGRRKDQYYLELSIGDKVFLKEVNRKQKVQADYMRQLLCELFETPKKVNWKMCQRTPDQLTKERQEFEVELAKAGLMGDQEL